MRVLSILALTALPMVLAPMSLDPTVDELSSDVPAAAQEYLQGSEAHSMAVGLSLEEHRQGLNGHERTASMTEESLGVIAFAEPKAVAFWDNYEDVTGPDYLGDFDVAADELQYQSLELRDGLPYAVMSADAQGNYESYSTMTPDYLAALHNLRPGEMLLSAAPTFVQSLVFVVSPDRRSLTPADDYTRETLGSHPLDVPTVRSYVHGARIEYLEQSEREIAQRIAEDKANGTYVEGQTYYGGIAASGTQGTDVGGWSALQLGLGALALGLTMLVAGLTLRASSGLQRK